MSHLEDKDIPNLITIDVFTYSYKGRKVNYNFAYIIGIESAELL